MDRRSVLVVDDDPNICLTIQDFLQHESYLVQVAGTGQEALAQVHDHHFDVVLLDVKLPDQDGLAVLAALRKLDPHLPVTILIALTTMETTIGSLSRWAFAYLTKPYNREEHRVTLQRAVQFKTLTARAASAAQAWSESEGRL